ncbi:hypothetical protein [Pseudomonas sp. LS-2]|uniref:hypothetical protein n=1 Tax=Pseudomonas sp. LS-2 TaxID=2315859 RepID=UPI000E736AF5|nr:hypothetical protein [Pseudomonas sp. LS-2]RJX72580.1 hypothetical protein D3M70_30720 [Pseudomonas sp. LS-2]
MEIMATLGNFFRVIWPVASLDVAVEQGARACLLPKGNESGQARHDLGFGGRGWDDVYKARGMTHRIQAGGAVFWMRYPTIAGIDRALAYKGVEGEHVQLFEL